MPIFYRKAVEAAIHPARVDWLTEAQLTDWNGLWQPESQRRASDQIAVAAGTPVS